MSKDRTSSAKDAERAARAERLASALRENLKRRKAQARVRAARADAKPADGKSDPGAQRRHRE